MASASSSPASSPTKSIVVITLKQGLLRKKGAQGWRKKHVSLTPALLMFQNVADAGQPVETISLQPTGVVGTPSLHQVRGSRGFTHRWFAFSYANGGGDDDDHWFAAETEALALEWKREIEAACAELQQRRQSPQLGEVRMTKSKKQLELREKMKRAASVGNFSLARVSTTLRLISQSNWETSKTTNGIRIMAEIGLPRDHACVKCMMVMPARPERVFRMLNDLSVHHEWDGTLESATVISMAEDEHFRRVHVRMRQQNVRGVRVAKRDFVVDSSWRREEDGSFIVIERTPEDFVPPPVESGYVRAHIFALGYTITPKKLGVGSEEVDSSVEECLLQVAVHANPGGWLGKLPKSFGEEWMHAFLLRCVGLKEALLLEEFSLVDFSALNAEATGLKKRITSHTTALSGKPGDGSLPREHWRHPEEPFKVRSMTYLTDKKKVNCDSAKFELVAMDLLRVKAPLDHIVANIKGGVGEKLANAPNAPFLFVVNFQVPDSPRNLCFVAYFQAKPGVLEGDTGFPKLFKDFVQGADSYRDLRFKFIPRVVHGSYIVKSAVGSTPCILGTKLVQSYHQGNNYFEVDVDVNSSSVAGGVLKVVKGYVTSLTIDLAFLLEPQAADEMPETVLGAVQFSNLNLNMAVSSPKEG